MLHAKFNGHWSTGSGEEDFLMFYTIYGHGNHIGHVIQLICKNFHSNSPLGFYMSFGSKSPNCFCKKQVLTLKSE